MNHFTRNDWDDRPDDDEPEDLPVLLVVGFILYLVFLLAMIVFIVSSIMRNFGP